MPNCSTGFLVFLGVFRYSFLSGFMAMQIVVIKCFKFDDTKFLHVLNSGVLPFFPDNARYLCYYFLVLVNVVLFNKRALSKK